MSSKRIRIAVDIGGTFTDLEFLDEASGATHSFKTATTPDDPSIGTDERDQGRGRTLRLRAVGCRLPDARHDDRDQCGADAQPAGRAR